MTLARINLAVMAVSSVAAFSFYTLSVRPAALQRRCGERALRWCRWMRGASIAAIFLQWSTFVAWAFLPAALPLPLHFAWPRWVSVILAGIILVPSVWLVCRGIRDAGESTLIAQAGLYGGIYLRIRHPQALGGMPLWFVLALLLHSPFLMLVSAACLPAWIFVCFQEERDLAERFGAPYQQYRRRTGFMFPRRPHPRADTQAPGGQ